MADLAPIEKIKADSRGLRGTLADSIDDPKSGGLAENDTQLLRLHGSYQQDDRDIRDQRRLQKLEPLWRFMVRLRLPAGVCSPAQWLAIDAIARTYANSSLRLTTRQTFQFHGIAKGDLRPSMAALNAALLDTIATCGDVNRNVLASANPVESPAHAAVAAYARQLSEHLLPKTRAYHEIFLNGEKLAGGAEVEPVYGNAFLPRKFKTAIAVPPSNDVDVFANDLGFIAIVEDGALAGFNLTVGGGLGATHGDARDLSAAGGRGGLSAARAAAGGRRSRGHHAARFRRSHQSQACTPEVHDRRSWARLVRRRGREALWLQARAAAAIRIHLERRSAFGLARRVRRPLAPHVAHPGGSNRRPLRPAVAHRLARDRQVPHGRLPDNGQPECDHRRGRGRPSEAQIDELIARYRLDAAEKAIPLRRDALACVALPSCPLAMAEAERYLPQLLSQVESLLERHGIAELPLILRITGCPNGCARPYLAEIGLVGKAPGRYNLHLGGDARGQRLAVLHRENLDQDGFLAELDQQFCGICRRASRRTSDSVIFCGGAPAVSAPPPPRAEHRRRSRMRYFPLFLDLRDRLVVVVGGGAVAERKVELLRSAGARIRLVAPRLTTALAAAAARGSFEHHGRSFVAADLDGARLAIAATSDGDVNRLVAAAAEARGVVVNVVDDVGLSSGIVPAVVDRSPLLIAISSEGTAPALARWVRQRIETTLDESVGRLAGFCAAWRARIKAGVADLAARRRFYDWLLTGPAANLLRARRLADADRAVAAALAAGVPPPAGSVVLVGAGPGDPGLLTLHALRALQSADVVLHDRLVSAEIVRLARRDAELIEVGKGGAGHGVTQGRINALLVEHARRGRRIVRLKGGDPFVFGRGGEELEHLVRHGVPFEVVPGVTAALACAAYAGIPLTHRDYSASVRFVTAHCRESLETTDWRGLALGRETLAVYMGVAMVETLRRELVTHGRAPSTPVAFIENGSRAEQRVIVGTLGEIAAMAQDNALQSPALLVIGEVAALARTLHWFGAAPIETTVRSHRSAA